MTSSAEDQFVGGGGEARHGVGGVGGGGEEQRLLMLRSCYHVPQHSRREKLRFPAEDSSPPPPLYPVGNSLTTAAAAFLPSSSSSFQFDAHGEVVVSSPHAQHQIPGGGQGFLLSLASPRPAVTLPPPASRPPAPLGPFTGYAAVLSRSRFLEPARKLLEEVCCRAAPLQQQAAAGSGGSGSDDAREMLLEADHGMEQQWRKRRLISMLDEVYRRYKQYYLQVQAVISSFESVAGLSNAVPFGSVVLKLMSKHFRCLNNAISGQLRRTNSKDFGNISLHQEPLSSFELLNSSSYHHQIRTANNAAGSLAQPHAWRHQRGLPERAVSVLRAWLFDHFLHPYPTDVDKQNLAKQTGLTRNQVSNWFINARVRLWKPMVEEVHSLEMRKKNKTSAAVHEMGNRDERLVRPMPSSSFECHQQFQVARVQSTPMSAHEHAGGGNGGGSGVSLTLGLHQNAGAGGGACFGEPLDPINVARRLGLEECNETYLVSALGGQERQLVKDESSRLLRDFVG